MNDLDSREPASPGRVVGVVGLGAMGGPIARHLLDESVAVVCADLDPELLSTYANRGARPAEGLADLAACSDVVLVVVQTDEDVMAVCTGPGSVLPSCRPGTSVLLCSSIRPETCKLVAASAPNGVNVLDAALTGGVRGAEAGTINLLVGGDADVLDTVRPLLKPWTSHVHHLGPLGTGQVAKTVNNLIHWAQISAITESLELGRRYGLDVATLRAALMDGPTYSRSLRDLELLRFTWHAKDIANAETMATAVGLPLPVAETAREVMQTIDVAKVAALLTRGGDGDGREITSA